MAFGTGATLSGTKILIVEDESVVALDLCRRLEQRGYQVIGRLARGEDVLPFVRGNCPDLVLMDIGLRGEMDGVTAASNLFDELKIPSIFVTAHADERTVERAQLAEPLGYLVKPFKDAELFASIQTSLYRYRMETRRSHRHDSSDYFSDSNGSPKSLPPDRQVIEILREVDLFSHLPDEKLQEFASNCALETIDRGATLYSEGDRYPSPFLLCSGAATLNIGIGVQKSLLVDFVVPGDLLGLISALDDGAAAYSVRFEDQSQVVLLPRTGFQLLLDEFPMMSLELAKYMSRRLRESDEFLRTIALCTAEGKIAEVLVRLNSRFGGELRLPITRRQIAAMTGLTIETAVRTMKSLEAREVLESSRPGSVKIIRPDELKRIAAA